VFGKFLSAVGFLVLLLFCAPAAAQERPKVFLGASSKTLGYSPLWVGAKRGFFEQQGLDVQLVLLRGVPMTLQALAAGSLQIGSRGPEPYIEATERGLDFAIAGGIVNGMAQVLIAGKSFKTVEDLRGGTIGASSLTSATVTALKEALKQKGLEYPRDYKILIVAGGSASNLQALQSGQISATTVAVPLNYAAEELGFNALGRLLDAVPNFQAASLAIRSSWAGKNQPVMIRFMKAMVQSLALRQPGRRGRIHFQGNAAQTGSRSQGLGILYAESDLAGGWRTNHRGDETQSARVCRANRSQGTVARCPQVRGTKLSD
jgi:ABC-type nitrate/sulfonate/bicarbonate transport system substrate-binding protein